MDKPEFLALLKERGFPDPVLVEYPANKGLDIHTHNFEALALIIEGSMTITTDGVRSNYSVGDIFHLKYQQPHEESYGLHGVKYLAGRRQP